MPLLPLLLALPDGIVAGVPAPLIPPSGDPDPLASFGPHLRNELDLRHAAFSPPRRLVVTLPPDASLASDASVAAMARAGATVVLIAPGLAPLLRNCHRVLVGSVGGAMRWEAPSSLEGRRVLCLRLEGAGHRRRLSLPLGPRGAEPVLAACRARGWTVRESRVEYDWSPAR